MSLCAFSFLVPLHGTKFPHRGKEDARYECYALLSVSEPLCHHVFWQLHLLCCWPEHSIPSRLSGAAQLSGTSYSPSVNPGKHGVFSVQEGNCAVLSLGAVTPMQQSVIIPSFTSISRTLREEFASRQKRLYQYIYIDFFSFMTFSNLFLFVHIMHVHVLYWDFIYWAIVIPCTLL